MGKKSTPEQLPAQKKPALSGNIPAQEAPGKMPPQFSLSAEPVQAKAEEGGLLETGANMVKAGMEWLSNWWNGDSEPQTADKVDAKVDPQAGDAPAKEGGQEEAKAPAPVVADTTKGPATPPAADSSKGAVTPAPEKQAAAPLSPAHRSTTRRRIMSRLHRPTFAKTKTPPRSPMPNCRPGRRSRSSPPKAMPPKSKSSTMPAAAPSPSANAIGPRPPTLQRQRL